MLLSAAISRDDVANYVGALFEVYIALLLIYLLINLVLGFGARPPYSRWFDHLMTFLRDVSDPWLRIFRKFIPSFGGIDLSPIVALIVLEVIARIVVHLISG